MITSFYHALLQALRSDAALAYQGVQYHCNPTLDVANSSHVSLFHEVD